MTFFTVQFVLEIFAVVSALAYVLLASKQNFLCWPMSLLSCTIYAWLCYDVKLYLESFLQVFYFAFALYGWFKWYEKSEILKPSFQSFSKNIKVVFGLFLVGTAIGFFVSNFTDAALPFVDSLIFVYSIYATYITALKIIESWIYWIVIDLVSVFVYINRGLHVTSLLFLLYTILAFFGFFAWFKSWKLQQKTL